MDRPGTSVGVIPRDIETGPNGGGTAVVLVGDEVSGGEVAAGVAESAGVTPVGDGGGDTCSANWAGRVYKDVPPVAAHRPCTVMVMSAVPVQAAGRTKPEPASSTGVVVGPVVVVPAGRVLDTGGSADAVEFEPDGDGEAGDSEADVDADGL